ncbi:unnamed protein product [Schistocephalus solidus]|uniref:C2H2-type domain-containing protein n=1 Tax=Schistocephalus solidus TaxID=70667 RepID=A0A183SQF3_SCHSO|nr:unnamed protein product [Schistocephalus solidus]
MKVTSAPDQHRRCSGPANMPALSTHLPRASWPGWTSSDAMHQFPTSGINSITPTIIETTPLYSSPVTPTTATIIATTTAFAFTSTTTTTTTSDGESLLNCPQCDRKFTSHIGLVGRLRIHRTETGEPIVRPSILMMSNVCPTEGWCGDGDLRAATAFSPPPPPSEPGVMTESRRSEAGEDAGGWRGRRRPYTARAGQLSDAEVGAAAGDLVYVYYVHDLDPQTRAPGFHTAGG